MQRQINNLIRRIKNVLAIGTIHSVDDDYHAQASFLFDEPKDKTYIAQHYGFTSKPLKDAEAYGVCPGSRQSLVIVATDDKRYRIKVKNGEVALYTDEGDSIHFKRGNKLELKTKTLSLIHKDKKTDLVGIIHDVFEGLEQALIPTMMGPQALSTQKIFAEAKLKIKEYLDA